MSTLKPDTLTEREFNKMVKENNDVLKFEKKQKEVKNGKRKKTSN